jgi:hypothetical protein
MDRRGDWINGHLDWLGTYAEQRYDRVGDRINNRLDRRDWRRHHYGPGR